LRIIPSRLDLLELGLGGPFQWQGLAVLWVAAGFACMHAEVTYMGLRMEGWRACVWGAAVVVPFPRLRTTTTTS